MNDNVIQSWGWSVDRDMTRLLVILAALAFSASASAQLYKWVDKDGRVQYGDNPPPNTKATRLKPPPGVPSASAPADAKKDGASKNKPLSPEAAFKKRQQERQEQEQKTGKERADAEQRRAGCDQAQASLRQLQSGQRMSTVNAAGERVFIDDEQRAKEIERAQKSVAEWCK